MTGIRLYVHPEVTGRTGHKAVQPQFDVTDIRHSLQSVDKSARAKPTQGEKLNLGHGYARKPSYTVAQRGKAWLLKIYPVLFIFQQFPPLVHLNNEW